MKKNLLILLVLVISLTLAGCGNNEKKEQAVVIDQLDIEEGCYKTETNSNNLICITKDLSYYAVLYKDLQKNYPTQVEQLNYIEKNYSYDVTVDGKTFKYTEAFPIDPYSDNEKMVVNIIKK